MAVTVSTSPVGRRRARGDGDARKRHRLAVHGDDRVASALGSRHARLQQHARDRAPRAGQALAGTGRAQHETGRESGVQRAVGRSVRAMHERLAVCRRAGHRERHLRAGHGGGAPSARTMAMRS